MNSKIREVFSWLMTLFFYVGIALLIRFFVFNITSVEGLSMYPYLDDGDKLITQKISLYYRDPEIGEIVVVDAPDHRGAHYIKRVIADGGDQVSLENGEVLVNGEVIDEPYLIYEVETYPNLPGKDKWEVPEDHIFVMGDNRGASNDSRSFGPLHVDEIVGISEFRIYPFHDIGSI